METRKLSSMIHFLKKNDVVSIYENGNRAIKIHSGAVWLTSERNQEDVIVRCSSFWFDLSGSSRVVIQALEDAVFELSHEPRALVGNSKQNCTVAPPGFSSNEPIEKEEEQ